MFRLFHRERLPVDLAKGLERVVTTQKLLESNWNLPTSSAPHAGLWLPLPSLHSNLLNLGLRASIKAGDKGSIWMPWMYLNCWQTVALISTQHVTCQLTNINSVVFAVLPYIATELLKLFPKIGCVVRLVLQKHARCPIPGLGRVTRHLDHSVSATQDVVKPQAGGIVAHQSGGAEKVNLLYS